MLKNKSLTFGRNLGRAILLFVVLAVAGLWISSRANATPPAPGPQPISLVTVTHCNLIVAVIVVMTDGTLHPVPLERANVEKVNRIIAQFPTDIRRNIVAVVKCQQEPNA